MADYSDDVAEAMTLADASESAGEFNSAQAEAMTLLDSPIVSVVGYGVAIQEAGDMVDFVSSQFSGSSDVSEAMSLADVVTTGMVYTASLSDAVSLADLVAMVPEPGQYDYYFQFDSAIQAKLDPVVGPYIEGSDSQNAGLYDTRTNTQLPGFWVMLSQDLPLNSAFLASPYLKLVVNATLQAQGQASVWTTTLNRELLLHMQIVAFYAGGAIYGYSRIVNGQG